MNILPKKSWHVRNKDNVARVRRDEAKALEEEQECARRKALAEQEARIRMLREKAKNAQKQEKEAQWDLPQEPAAETVSDGEDSAAPEEPYVPLNTAFPAHQHINLFEDFEKKKKSQGSNKEYENEKKKAQEDYEKKIGYLTYLGQSATEISKQKPWYEQTGKQKEAASSVTYSQYESLQAADPLLDMKDYLHKKREVEQGYHGNPTPSVKSTRKRKYDSSSSVKAEKLPTSDVNSQDDKPKDSHKSKKSHKDKKSKKHKKSRHRSVSPEAETPAKPSIEQLRAAREAREAAEKRRSLDLVARYQGFLSPAHSVIDERRLTYNSVYNVNPRATKR